MIAAVIIVGLLFVSGWYVFREALIFGLLRQDGNNTKANRAYVRKDIKRAAKLFRRID